MQETGRQKGCHFVYMYVVYPICCSRRVLTTAAWGPAPIGSIPPTLLPRLLHPEYGPLLTYIHLSLLVMAMEMMYYSMAALNGNLSDQLQSQLGYLPMQNGDQKGFQPSYKRMAQSEFFS